MCVTGIVVMGLFSSEPFDKPFQDVTNPLPALLHSPTAATRLPARSRGTGDRGRDCRPSPIRPGRPARATATAVAGLQRVADPGHPGNVPPRCGRPGEFDWLVFGMLLMTITAVPASIAAGGRSRLRAQGIRSNRSHQRHPRSRFGRGGAAAQMADRLPALLTATLPSDADFPDLTARDNQILGLLAEGRDNADIAHELALSLKTVRNYVSSILTKLEVPARAQAIVKARDAGMNTPRLRCRRGKPLHGRKGCCQRRPSGAKCCGVSGPLFERSGSERATATLRPNRPARGVPQRIGDQGRELGLANIEPRRRPSRTNRGTLEQPLSPPPGARSHGPAAPDLQVKLTCRSLPSTSQRCP